MGNGRLIVIAAPSGGGKTTVIKHLQARHPEMVHSISCTTRPKRPGEVDGKYYHHLNRTTFEDGLKNSRFVEWAAVHDNLYGTPKEPLDNWLAQGKDVLLDLDVVGSLNIKKIYGPRSIIFFLLPPSLEELKKRLAGRRTDSEEVQALRLKNALEELTHKDESDYRIINDDLNRACGEIERLLFP